MLGSSQHVIDSPAHGGKVILGLPGCSVPLNAVGLPGGHGLVVQAVIERLRERQDMFDLHLVGQQHRHADLYPTVGAAAICRIVAVKLFPEDQFVQISGFDSVGSNTQQFSYLAAHPLIAALVLRLTLLLLLALISALF